MLTILKESKLLIFRIFLSHNLEQIQVLVEELLQSFWADGMICISREPRIDLDRMVMSYKQSPEIYDGTWSCP